jgi:tryptophan 7-halogenase
VNRKKIAILGNDSVAWATAIMLRSQWSPDVVEVILITETSEHKDSATSIGKKLRNFHDVIGIQEQNLLLQTSSSFQLGILYQGWASPQQHYVFSSEPAGLAFEGNEFQSVYTKLTQGNQPYAYDNYSLSAVAAKMNRFAHPADDPQSIYARLHYGINLDLTAYCLMLKNIALNAGVSEIVGVVDAVNCSTENGYISSLRLTKGDIIGADLFIDCSEERTLIGNSALNVSFISEPIDAVFDRCAIGSIASNHAQEPLTWLSTVESGYIKKIPLHNRDIIAYHYSTHATSDKQAQDLLHRLGASEIYFATKKYGHLDKYWVKNCVSLGAAAACFHDLSVSPFQLALNSIVLLSDLLVSFDFFDSIGAEFNRKVTQEVACLNIINELHFYLAKNNSEVLSQHYKNHFLSAEAEHKLKLFESMGRHSVLAEDLLTSPEWASFFIGNGIVPRTYAQPLDAITHGMLFEFSEKIRLAIVAAAKKMPTQAQYIRNLHAKNNGQINNG